MFKQKYDKLYDLIVIPFRIIPLQTTAATFNMLVNAFIPAYQTLAVAYFINTATDIFNQKMDFSSIYRPIFLIMGYVMLTHFLPIIMNVINSSGSNKLSLTLEKEIVSKCARLEYKHIENEDTCDLINRVITDPSGNIQKGSNTIFSGISLLISTFSLLTIIMSVAFWSGIVILITSIPLVYAAMKLGEKSYRMGMDAQKIQRKYRYLSEILTDREYADERTLFGYEPFLSKKYDEWYNESFKIERTIKIKSYAILKSGSLVSLLLAIGMIALLLPELFKGRISIGIYIALTNAILSLVQNMSWQLSDIVQEYACSKQFLKDFSSFWQLSEKKDAFALPADMGCFEFESLEFKNVSFKYPGVQQYVLRNCSFSLYRGRSYAFVGENGAGKTTIIKLLAGMYDDYEGEILINGKNLRNYNFGELKGLISVVYQDFAKYALTIKENIALGNIEKNDEELIHNLIEEIGLEEMVQRSSAGINMHLGKINRESQDISGGEWQRLAIARLLYSDSKINILDEPTAALDPLEESRVYQMFRNISKGRFTICITHRLGAAKMSDEILVISNGHIEEQGTHETLMSSENGLYQRMFKNQKSWYDSEYYQKV